MRRRDILAGAGSLAAGATLSFPAPAIAQGIRQLKMVTDWPEGLPGLHPARFVSRRRSAPRPAAASRSRCFRPARSSARSKPSTRWEPASPTCITRTKATSKRSRRRSISSRPYLSASPRTNCSPGSSTAAARSCGTRSAASSTSSRSSAPAPAPRWAAGSPARSPRRRGSRGCATGCPGSAPRCSGGWAPSW